MDANRIAHIRRTLEATTAPPDVCTMGHYINIVSGSTPREVQADARFYRQAWFFVRDLLDAVDPQEPAAQRCTREGLGAAMAADCESRGITA